MDRSDEGAARASEAPARALAAGQGLAYAATGLWPLLSRRTFEAVTGPKTDWWLVQTVGVLVTVVGATPTTAAASGRVSADVRRLAAGSALGLAAIDVVHVARRRISAVYLLDAAAELAAAAAWLAVAAGARRAEEERRRGGASPASGREQPR